MALSTDEQAIVDRVDGVLLGLEAREPAVQKIRQIPMDMVTVAVMRQLARDGAAWPASDDAIAHALTEIVNRHHGS